MVNSNKPKEHIVISQKVKNVLDRMGNKGDTYENIIVRLLQKTIKYNKNKNTEKIEWKNF